MTVSDALDIVHELACLNQLDELATSGDASLAAHARWQQDALDRLGGLLFEHGEAIDTTLALPSLSACAPVPDWVCQPVRDMDPIVPSNAVRICLDLAQDTALDAVECGADPTLLAGRARQKRAFAITRAFLDLRAEAFDAALQDPEPSAGDDPEARRPRRMTCVRARRPPPRSKAA
jgi:hypothetical protein